MIPIDAAIIPITPTVQFRKCWSIQQPLYGAHLESLLLKSCENKYPTRDDQIEAFETGCAWFETHLLAPSMP